MRHKSKERIRMGEKAWEEHRKELNRNKQKAWYDRNSKKKSEQVKLSRREKKIAIVLYKGGKCSKCGYNKSVAALDFHHVDPKKKSFSISESRTRSLESLKKEADKCILLCKNCHTEVHDEVFRV